METYKSVCIQQIEILVRTHFYVYANKFIDWLITIATLYCHIIVSGIAIIAIISIIVIIIIAVIIIFTTITSSIISIVLVTILIIIITIVVISNLLVILH